MKIFGVLFILGFTSFVKSEFCYNDVANSCNPKGGGIGNCNSNYSGVDTVAFDLQHYAAVHLEQNWKYLLMSVYFNNYEANREGFSKLYRKLADDAWDDTLDLIKYMAKRGFNMDYNITPRKKVSVRSYKMSEIESLATALDMHKVLAETAHEIHNEVSGRNKKVHDAEAEAARQTHSEVTARKKKYHDAETINFLEKEFVEKHAGTIRDLAGHANDLHQLIKGNTDPSLAIYMFDEHLKKVVG